MTSDLHRFTIREHSFEVEEKMQDEMQQLTVHKKEQYVSQASCMVSVEILTMRAVMDCKCARLTHRASLCAG